VFTKVSFHQTLLTLGLICLIPCGCATTQKITDDIMGTGPTLDKKIAILPSEDAGGGQNDVHELVPAVVANFLERNCEGLLIVETPALDDALSGVVTSEGNIDKLALAEVGRIHGLSAVVHPRIDDLRLYREKRGIWGFREVHTLLEMALHIRMFDIETTAVLLDDLTVEETVVPHPPAEDEADPLNLDDGFLRSVLFQVTDRATEQICVSLRETPWKGYITQSDGDTFHVSAGQDVGLRPGDRLEVFAMADPIEGVNEQIYLVPGQKIGEIEVEEVFERHSTAVKRAGENLEKSACLMLKR